MSTSSGNELFNSRIACGPLEIAKNKATRGGDHNPSHFYCTFGRLLVTKWISLLVYVTQWQMTHASIWQPNNQFQVPFFGDNCFCILLISKQVCYHYQDCLKCEACHQCLSSPEATQQITLVLTSFDSLEPSHTEYYWAPFHANNHLFFPVHLTSS